MNWQEQLREIAQSTSLVPSFDEWLDATGHRIYVQHVGAGPINVQATALHALYDYYETEMKRRKI